MAYSDESSDSATAVKKNSYSGNLQPGPLEKRKIKNAFRRFATEVSDHYGIFETEVSVFQADYSAFIKAANSGDVVAAKKLLTYLRSCLMSGDVPDQEVARWASTCLFEVLKHGISADKAFSLKPETGRPPKGGKNLASLITWGDVEALRAIGKLEKTDALAALQEKRKNLSDHLWKQHREAMEVEELSTLTKLYRQGARIVKQYVQETGKKPPAFY